MQILVFGSGAVGSLLGGLLGQHGHQVTLLGRESHMEAIRETGLQIEGIWGSHCVRSLQTTSDPQTVGNTPFDLVLITVKAYDTPLAIETLRGLDRPGLLFVSCQNGYGNVQALEQAFGHGRVLGARIITGVELHEPGRVVVTVSADDIRLGPPRGEPELMELACSLADTLRDAGIPVSATDKYSEILWSKILYNCALNPLGALLRARYGELAADQGTRQLMDTIIGEAFAVTQAHGIRLFWDQPDQYRRHFYTELIPPTVRHYPSMLRDLERRGRTEIDALNGAIVRLADEAGLAAPINLALTSMIKLREQTRRAELRETHLGPSSTVG